MQVNAALLVAIVCFVICLAGAVVLILFYRKDRYHLGIYVSIVGVIPFFLAFCYLLWKVVSRVGASI